MDVMVLKASLLLAAALGVARSLRRAPAVMRHGLWTVAFAALLALPLLAATLPGFACNRCLPVGGRRSTRGRVDRLT